jgi:hypothetical protein
VGQGIAEIDEERHLGLEDIVLGGLYVDQAGVAAGFDGERATCGGVLGACAGRAVARCEIDADAGMIASDLHRECGHTAFGHVDVGDAHVWSLLSCRDVSGQHGQETRQRKGACQAAHTRPTANVLDWKHGTTLRTALPHEHVERLPIG